MIAPEVRKEHLWLQQLAGDWVMQPPEDGQGCGGEVSATPWVESIRMLHGLWLVAESSGEMPGGGPATCIMTLGYDPARQVFVGSWIGSMMTHMYVYEGHLDAAGRVLTLDCEGPDFQAPERATRYRDLLVLEGDGTRSGRSLMQAADGSWTEVMNLRFRRRETLAVPRDAAGQAAS